MNSPNRVERSVVARPEEGWGDYRLGSWLTGRRTPWLLAGLSFLLCLGSVDLGWYADDYTHQAILTGDDRFADLKRSAWDIFAFLGGDPEVNKVLIRQGHLPWWSDPQLKLAFFRPVTSLTHWLDYQLWPTQPRLMHLHSLLWLALAVFLATRLYRRILAPFTAGLAALLFALDDAHSVPAMWISNRNATVAIVFGLLSLLAHDRYRREGWRPGAVVAPLCLALSLLSSESGIATAGFLFAYVLFIDPNQDGRRRWSIVPAIVTVVVWMGTYHVLGYGAANSGLYVSPLAEPGRYLGAVLERAPALLWGVFALPSELFTVLSHDWSRALWLGALLFLLVVASFFARGLESSPTAGFWLTGTLLALLPACVTFPSDRLLFFAGVGGSALIGEFLATTFRQKRRPAASLLGGLLVIFHLLLAPVGLLMAPVSLGIFRDVIAGSAETWPDDPAVTDQRVVVVTTPTAFVSLFAPLMKGLEGRPLPRSFTVLGSGLEEMELQRPAADTLVLKPVGGFLRPARSRSFQADPGALDPRNVFTLFDHLFVAEPAMSAGQEIELDGITARILETSGGRPLSVAFRFDRPLEDAALRWICWQDGVYAPFTPPPVGENLILPALTFD